MSDNPVCLSCIRWVKDLCTKEQVPPLEDQTCRFFVEKEKYLSQIKPKPAPELVTEPKTSIEDVELGRLRSENSKLRAELGELRKLLPPDPVGELLTRLLPKLALALEKGTLTSYKENGKNTQIVDSFNYKKLKGLNLVSEQTRTITYEKKMFWFTKEFESRIRARLAETGAV